MKTALKIMVGLSILSSIIFIIHLVYKMNQTYKKKRIAAEIEQEQLKYQDETVKAFLSEDEKEKRRIEDLSKLPEKFGS